MKNIICFFCNKPCPMVYFNSYECALCCAKYFENSESKNIAYFEVKFDEAYPKIFVHYYLLSEACNVEFLGEEDARFKNGYRNMIVKIPIEKMLVSKSELLDKVNTIRTYL